MLLSRLSRSSPRSSDTTAPWWGDMHEVGVRVGDVMCGCVPVSLSVFLPHSHSSSLCSLPGSVCVATTSLSGGRCWCCCSGFRLAPTFLSMSPARRTCKARHSTVAGRVRCAGTMATRSKGSKSLESRNQMWPAAFPHPASGTVVVVVVVLWQQAERESDRQGTRGKWPVVMRAMQC